SEGSGAGVPEPLERGTLPQGRSPFRFQGPLRAGRRSGRAVNSPGQVLSPCTGICELDADGRCAGCRRTTDEIAGWLSFSPAQRQYRMEVALPEREAAAPRV